jgi:hypothetical protein
VTASRHEPRQAPPGLWQRPEMARALAERELGTVVRIFRQWTGASQTDISVLVGIPQPHISGLEHGKRQVTSLEVFERFADGLGIPRRLLGLAATNGEQGETGTPSGAGVNYRDDETDEKVRASHREWLTTRRQLNQHRAELTQLVSRLYPPAARLGSTGILAPGSWRLSVPVDLASVQLAWQDNPPAPVITGQHTETLPLRPLISPGRHYSRYHRAVRDLDRPRLFENRLCYRLLNVDPGSSGTDRKLTLSLGDMCYFDMIDVGETLAHETALAALGKNGDIHTDRLTWERLPFRRVARDPFALAAYPLMLSVSTLTIRRSPAGTTFLMLRRNPAKVAIAGGMYSVYPTGVFQPASVLPAPASPDFDLWRNVMREYSEEYLGNPEHDGDGPPSTTRTKNPSAPSTPPAPPARSASPASASASTRSTTSATSSPPPCSTPTSSTTSSTGWSTRTTKATSSSAATGRNSASTGPPSNASCPPSPSPPAAQHASASHGSIARRFCDQDNPGGAKTKGASASPRRC